MFDTETLERCTFKMSDLAGKTLRFYSTEDGKYVVTAAQCVTTGIVYMIDISEKQNEPK